VFERRNGHASILVEAASLWDGSAWVEQPLPYGATARLIMVYISSEAVARAAAPSRSATARGSF
jgi:hypothetical protein